MTTRTVNRLLGLEIDEVSFVDRPANQHGLVAITKRDTTGDNMGTGLYDETGAEYDADELEPGMRVLDADGQLRILLDEETAEALEQEGVNLEDTDEIEAVLAELGGIPDDASELDGELAGVGKGLGGRVGTSMLGLAHRGGQAAGRGRQAAVDATYKFPKLLGTRTRRLTTAGGAAAITGGTTSAVSYVGGRNRGREEVATAKRFTGRSMGNALLADLSKAYTDGERDRVVTKAFEELSTTVSKAEQRAIRAERIAKAAQERDELATYTEIAKGYELPVDPSDLGPILQTIAKSGLTPEQLDLVDQVFSAAGEAIFVEKGFSGRQESSVMEYIGGEALELVGKADGDFTPEQAAAAIMLANPDAYEDYLAEQYAR